jgi:outer membrane lipoprotein-sorting protein
VCAASAKITEQSLKTKITALTKDLQDLSMTGTVVQSNKDALAEVEPNFARLYEFKSAKVMLKLPDRLRMEGKLGMVRVEYVVNGSTKIFRASPIKVNKREEYPDDPAKLQGALDVGLVTPTMWKNRRIEIVDDSDADTCGEIKLRLRWPKGDMVYYAWLDAQNLWLKKYEKYDSQGKLKARMVYSNPKNIFGNMWMPTRVEMYAPDGDKAGTSEMSDIKYNIGLPDSLFK